MDFTERMRREFEQVAAGKQFLELFQKVPDIWREQPAHFQIYVARRRAGLTQRQLAAKAGMHQSLVARVELGRDARISTMRRMYEALGYHMLIVPLKMPSHASQFRSPETGCTTKHQVSPETAA